MSPRRIVLVSAVIALMAPISPAPAQSVPYAPPPPPPPVGVLFSLSVTSAIRGAEISILGAGVGAATAVRIGEWNATIIARQPNAVTLLVPDAPAQVHPVTLALPAGNVVLRQSFTVQMRPDGVVGDRIDPPCEAGSTPAQGVSITSMQPANPKPYDLLRLEGSGLSDFNVVQFTIQTRRSARPDPSVFQADLVRVLNAYHVRVPRDAASGPIAVVKRSIIGTYGPCQPLNVVLQVDRSGR